MKEEVEHNLLPQKSINIERILVFSRPALKELLNHEFFGEDIGLRLELVSRDLVVNSDITTVQFRLKIIDPKKR